MWVPARRPTAVSTGDPVEEKPQHKLTGKQSALDFV